MERRELHPELDHVEKLRLLRLGATLFDQGSYFESHEPWEAIWRSRNPEPRDLFQGLVQVAAGFHHWYAHGRAGAASRLLERGARRLERLAAASRSSADPRAYEAEAEIDLHALREQVEEWTRWLDSRAGEPPPRPRLGSRMPIPTMSGPRFITFEGLDGSGKSSHLRRAAAALERGGVSLRVTQQPGGTALGERIRELFLAGARLDPLTELLLLFADRRHLLAEVVEPALASGLVVLCDRFTDSTHAYQGAGRGVPEELIQSVDLAATGARRPDRTVLFDLPPELARERSRSAKRRDAGPQGVNRFDEEALEFYRRVRAAYLERAAREPERFRVIDSSGERSETARQVAAALGDVLEPAAWEWVEVGS